MHAQVLHDDGDRVRAVRGPAEEVHERAHGGHGRAAEHRGQGREQGTPGVGEKI